MQAKQRGRSARTPTMVASGDGPQKPNELRIKEGFEKFDIDGSGDINMEELEWYFKGGQGKAMMKDMDTKHKDGKISVDEWTGYFTGLGAGLEMALNMLDSVIVTAPAVEHKAAQKVQAIQRGRRRRAVMGAPPSTKDVPTRIKESFEKFDLNSSGDIDFKELEFHLQSSDQAKAMLASMDTVHTDGKITMDEWAAYFNDPEKVNPSILDAQLSLLEGLVLQAAPAAGEE